MNQQRNKPKDTNQYSKILSNAENNAVFEVLGPRRVTKATAVVQLFFANQTPSQWAKQNTGILCFVKDNVKRSYYLRMVDINRRTVLWEHELYYQISYVQERKQFHSFAGQDFMIGFNFADAEEAHTFYEAVQVKIDEYKKKLNTKNNPAPRSAPDSGISAPTHPGTSAGTNGENSYVPSVSLFETRFTKDDISAPSNFKHLAHVGWNSQAGSFEWNNIQDDRWKNLFTEVSEMIGESELDKEQVQLIYDMVERKGGIEAAHRDIVERRNTARRNDPPPPPSFGKGRSAKDQAPPPTPLDGRRGNMPPPPPRGVDAPPIPDEDCNGSPLGSEISSENEDIVLGRGSPSHSQQDNTIQDTVQSSNQCTDRSRTEYENTHLQSTTARIETRDMKYKDSDLLSRNKQSNYTSSDKHIQQHKSPVPRETRPLHHHTERREHDSQDRSMNYTKSPSEQYSEKNVHSRIHHIGNTRSNWNYPNNTTYFSERNKVDIFVPGKIISTHFYKDLPKKKYAA